MSRSCSRQHRPQTPNEEEDGDRNIQREATGPKFEGRGRRAQRERPRTSEEETEAGAEAEVGQVMRAAAQRPRHFLDGSKWSRSERRR